MHSTFMNLSGSKAHCNGTSVFLILLLVGLLVRLVLLPTDGFRDDVSLWQNWAMKIRAFGFTRVYDPVWELPSGEHLGGVNHPPVNLYYLRLISGITTQLPYLHPASNLLVKLPSLLFDLLVVWMLIALARLLGFGSGWGWFIGLFYWLNPAIMYHGAFWGLNESVSAFVWLAVLFLILKQRYSWALALIIGSIGIKLQNIIFLPLVLSCALGKGSAGKMVDFDRKTFVQRMARVVKGGFLGMAILLLAYSPFLIAGTFTQAFQVLLDSVGYFPSLTKGAFNAWYFVDAAINFSIGDGEIAFGILSYRVIGIGLFCIASIVNCFVLCKRRFEQKALVTAFAIQGFSFFMLPTEMHERYVFYAIPFLLLLVVWGARWYWFAGSMSFFFLSNLVAVYNDYYGNLHIPLGYRYAIAGLYLVCYVILWYWYAKNSLELKTQNLKHSI